MLSFHRSPIVYADLNYENNVDFDYVLKYIQEGYFELTLMSVITNSGREYIPIESIDYGLSHYTDGETIFPGIYRNVLTKIILEPNSDFSYEYPMILLNDSFVSGVAFIRMNILNEDPVYGEKNITRSNFVLKYKSEFVQIRPELRINFQNDEGKLIYDMYYSYIIFNNLNREITAILPENSIYLNLSKVGVVKKANLILDSGNKLPIKILNGTISNETNSITIVPESSRNITLYVEFRKYENISIVHGYFSNLIKDPYLLEYHIPDFYKIGYFDEQHWKMLRLENKTIFTTIVWPSSKTLPLPSFYPYNIEIKKIAEEAVFSSLSPWKMGEASVSSNKIYNLKKVTGLPQPNITIGESIQGLVTRVQIKDVFGYYQQVFIDGDRSGSINPGTFIITRNETNTFMKISPRLTAHSDSDYYYSVTIEWKQEVISNANYSFLNWNEFFKTHDGTIFLHRENFKNELMSNGINYIQKFVFPKNIDLVRSTLYPENWYYEIVDNNQIVWWEFDNFQKYSVDYGMKFSILELKNIFFIGIATIAISTLLLIISLLFKNYSKDNRSVYFTPLGIISIYFTYYVYTIDDVIMVLRWHPRILFITFVIAVLALSDFILILYNEYRKRKS